MIEPSVRVPVLRTGSALVILALILVAVPPAFAEPPTLPDPALSQTLDNAIEQYIRAHPEVIEQSLQALEAKRETEEKARQKAAIVTRQNDLLHDPSSPVSGNP